MSRSPSAGGRAFLAARDFVLQHRADYDAAVRGFRWPALDRFNWALDYFDVIAAGNDATALRIVEEDGTVHVRTFAELAARSNRVANFLRALGVRRGDRVLVMLGNEVPLWETVLACAKLGAVVSPAAALLTPDDLRDRLDRGAIRHAIVDAAQVDKLAGIADGITRIVVGGRVPSWASYADAEAEAASFTPDGETRATDPLILYFTSGTTAKPKMVLHSHQSYPVGHLTTLFFTGIQPGDRHWNISSPGWAKHAWSSIFAPWNAGAAVFIYNYARFDAAAVLRVLAAHQVTTLCAPPTVWRLLVQEPMASYQVSLRELLSAGEPLNPEVIAQVRAAWGLTIRDGYGQTETTALVANTPGQTVKPGSMGRPLIGCPVVLLDPDGRPADEGELCLDLSQAPLCLTSGYIDAAGHVAAAWQGGYYHTGDVARRDPDGYITFIGRDDDVFKASDYRVSPFELESVLIEHPAVSEAAVVPSPDPIRHAVPKAFVVVAPGFAPSPELARDILRFARAALAPYKRIRRLEFAELPKTISGKIRRVELRAQEARRREAGERGAQDYYEEDFV